MMDMSESLLSALWRASWQGGLVIAALWCLCRALEKRLPADLRCWMWRTIYLKMLLGLVIVTGIALPILPAAPAPVLTEADNVVITETVLSSPRISPAKVTRTSFAADDKESYSSPFSGQTILFSFYVLGISVCLARITAAGLRTRAALRASVTDTVAQETARGIARSLRMPGQVPDVLRSPLVSIPFYTAGAVLLPAAADYSPEESRLILAHELAHARRRDLVWEWLGTLTQVVFFFHPLVLLARREERLARESATDALALRVTHAPVSVYGRLLLSISLSSTSSQRRDAGLPLAGALGAVEVGTLLRRRLLALKEFSLMSSSSYSRKLAAALVIVGAITFLPWRVTEAAPETRLPGSLTAPSALQDSRPGRMSLRHVPRLPLIPLAEALGLTPDQRNEISRIQKHTAQMEEKNLLQQTNQRRRLTQEYLPGVEMRDWQKLTKASQALQRERKQEWERYSKAMHSIIDTGKQQARLIETNASHDVLAVLTEEQEKALPLLLQKTSVLRSVGIPTELYTSLNLTPDQTSQIATIAQTLFERRRQSMTAAVAAIRNADKTLKEKLRQADPNQLVAKNAHEQRDRLTKRIFTIMVRVLHLQEEQAHEAALAVLTDRQRSAVKAYFQAHPRQANSLLQTPRKMTVRAGNIVRSATGLQLSNVVMTEYQDGQVISQVKANRAFIKTNQPEVFERYQAGKEFQIDQGDISEMKAHGSVTAVIKKQPS